MGYFNEEDLKPKYRIYKRKLSYYHNRNRKPLPKHFFMKPFYDKLFQDKNQWLKESKRITKGPGIYGIFSIDNYGNIKQCLYIGQSIDVRQRIEEHKEGVTIAKKDLNYFNKKIKLFNNGDKSKRRVFGKYKNNKYKNGCIFFEQNPDKRHTSLMYYTIVNYIESDSNRNANIKYLKLASFDKKEWSKMKVQEAFVCLTYFEQRGMDLFNPITNVTAARPSIDIEFNGVNFYNINKGRYHGKKS